MVRLSTGHYRLNSHMHRTLKLAPTRRPNHRACYTKKPPSQSYKRRCVACQHSSDDQPLLLQAGAGEDAFIHLPNGPYRILCKRQEEESHSRHPTRPTPCCHKSLRTLRTIIVSAPDTSTPVSSMLVSRGALLWLYVFNMNDKLVLNHN